MFKRNQLCPCGSGKRFKHCHGDMRLIAEIESIAAKTRPQPVREFERTRQQGRGKPIFTFELNGMRVVAVGRSIISGHWKTFTEFLADHIKHEFGAQWGAEATAKPKEEWHPLLHWLCVLGDATAKHITTPGVPTSIPEAGGIRALLSLAYDLYLIEHNANSEKDIQAYARLLQRLRHKDQFFGAKHEARAAGMLIRAGFRLVWEDEQAGDQQHGEFLATFPSTNRTYWVECKMRQGGRNTGVTHLVTDALKKEAKHERMVFVDVNQPGREMDGNKGWAGDSINQLRVLERQPNSANLPRALVFFSNFAEHHYLDTAPVGCGLLLEGFKTEIFRFGMTTLGEVIKEREENPEIVDLLRSIEEHGSIPSSFDASNPVPGAERRFQIGSLHNFGNGESGVLESGTVEEKSKKAACVFRLNTGERKVKFLDLTDAEIALWKLLPETFFGKFVPQSAPAKSPADLYDFFSRNYSDTPRKLLLDWLANDTDIESLRTMDQPTLVKEYALRMAAAADRMNPSKIPDWLARIRRRPKKEGRE